MAKDIFQSIGSLDADGLQRIIDRLEFRGKDQSFITMRDEYLHQMNIAPTATILDLGCGTGVVARALAAQDEFSGRIVGVDFSSDLVSAARRFTAEEGLDNQIEFRVGDASALDEVDESFDVVILHTLISHVPNPTAVVSEAARVTRHGGLVAIFDGDYASITYATGDHKVDAEMVEAILEVVVANPYIMRELPAIFRGVGLEIESFIPSILAEAGKGAFFSSLAESYTPIVIKSQTASEMKANGWLNAYRESILSKTAFASCNYYTYLARRP